MDDLARRWSVVVVSLVLVTAVVAVSCTGGDTTARPDSGKLAGSKIASVDTSIPRLRDLHDCIGDLLARGDARLTSAALDVPGALAVPGRIAVVPEYHDCQKLLIEKGKAYGPLVAIYAAQGLDSLEKQLESAAAVQIRAGTPAVVAALILNVDSDYAPLRIAHGYSCLFLGHGTAAGSWRARIDPNVDPRKCLGMVATLADGDTTWEVKADTASMFTESQYPAVARWDWDNDHKQQYIGIKCGAAWCEIGPKGFSHHPPYKPIAAGNSHAEAVQRIKGWYDEQFLAVSDVPHHLVPSQTERGYVIPDPDADALKQGDYASQWRNVAFVAIGAPPAHYKSKLNMDRTQPNVDLAALNHLAFCWGDQADCHVRNGSPGTPGNTAHPTCAADATLSDAAGKHHPWWAKITGAAQDHSEQYSCVTRIDHSKQVTSIPHTARWSWMEDDETIWKECLTGCCKVSSFQ